MSASLLSVRDLRVTFPARGGETAAVDGVSFDLAPGAALGVVGESGSGKSLTALAILRLIAKPGRIAGGSILFEGADLLARSEREMERLRGSSISMIFQEPMSSLNPVFSVGNQIEEPLIQHRGLDSKAARAESLRLLDLVEIPEARRRIEAYPHQLSGGMRQRVMIAIALACRPKLLIADEPTTALDVTIQAQILDLLRALRKELGMAVLLITHDLGVVAQFAERAVVMYAGRVAEIAATRDLFRAPAHPYTRGLLASMPALDGPRRTLNAIPGAVPGPDEMPSGCRFAPRCPEARAICSVARPPLVDLPGGRGAACVLHASAGGAAA